ncbi:retrovirus-related pol polyprotein from transposon TNT 1-94, partial [Tanacetum coccineum]
MLMARIQPADGNAEIVPSYDAKAVSKVNDSSKVHEQMRHEKRKTIIQTSDDDQIDSIIVFDDPYMENNVGTSDHDSNDHDEYHNIQMPAYDKSKFSTLNDENVLLKTQIDSVVKEQENVKLEYQNLFNSIKATPTQHKKELDELIEHVNQKTYAYADVRAQNQDLLITISELKNKLKIIDKGKNVNTKFDKFEASRTLICVAPLPTNIAIKGKKVSNSKVNADRSKPVTSHPTPINEQGQTQNKNVLARGMYRITRTKTQTQDSKTNINVSNPTGVESSNSVRRQKSKDTKSKNRVLKNTNAKSSTAHVRKMSRSVSIDSNKCETVNSTLCHANKSVLYTKNVTDVNDGSNIVCFSYGKDVFLLSHEKCVARYALSRNSNVRRAIFTTLVAVKSKNLGATFVVAKSRLSVANTPKETNKLVLWIVDSGCSKHMTDNLQLLRNFVEKFMGTVRFGNDHFAAITGYGDYVQSNLTICHNLEGDDLLTGSRDSNLYNIFIFEMAASSPMYLMSRATSTKSWLWHRRLSHLNFGTINQLTSKDLVDGLPKFKYNKDHLCSACEQGKSKKDSLPPKLIPSTESKLKLLHMDLCGPMRVASINGKKYIIVIVDDYSRYIWTDNGTEFKNEKLRAFYAKLGIVHQTLIARTPQQNGVVERQNHTLVEATRTMLIFSKALEFLWAEAIATACFTQNRSIVHTWYNKTPYELIQGRKPNIQNFYVFGSLYYPTNDRDDLGKMKPKADIAEQVATEPNSPVLNANANEFFQEDVADFDGNVFYNAPPTPMFKEAESYSTYQDPLNMHEFHQKHRSSDRWTKNHLIEQVIGDPSKLVMTRNRLQTDAEVCMYALTVSTIELKHIKEAMLDASWIESMQDKLNQFKHLDVWELVECPIGKNIIAIKWIWKNKTYAENMVI